MIDIDKLENEITHVHRWHPVDRDSEGDRYCMDCKKYTEQYKIYAHPETVLELIARIRELEEEVENAYWRGRDAAHYDYS